MQSNFEQTNGTMKQLKESFLNWVSGIIGGFGTFSLLDGFQPYIDVGIWVGKFLLSCFTAYIFGYIAEAAKHHYQKKYNTKPE